MAGFSGYNFFETSKSSLETFKPIISEKESFPDFFKEITRQLVNFETDNEALKQESLSQEEKVKIQDKDIALIESGETVLETRIEKGNYGEEKVDQDLRDKSYDRISIDMILDVKQKTHTDGETSTGRQGIDGVYYNKDGHPPYLIVEAKYGTGQLGITEDGKQMCDNWIDNRLDKAVGKEKADEIRMANLFGQDQVGAYLAHIDESGNVTYDKLDQYANVIEKDVNIGC